MRKKLNDRLIVMCAALFSVTFSCQKDKEIEVIEPGVIENITFNKTVLVDGHDFDGTIIKNCIFENIEGDGLQIRDVKGLCIENCVFRDISENAIRYRNSGGSEGVKILDNEIYNIKKNGILAAENHINSVIKGNVIYNVATDNTSSQFGAPHHGIYFQGFNVLITENIIYDILNDQGNCISIRTYGIISKNILYNATDHGVSYFSDHPANDAELLIENNMIYDNGKRGINLGSDGTVSNHIGSAVIRFNSIVSNDRSPIGLGDELTDVQFDLIGNILIRTDGQSPYIFGAVNYTTLKNLNSTTDIGFVNFIERDLHIEGNSSATGFATGVINFPIIDIDGDSRSSEDLDAGADEI